MPESPSSLEAWLDGDEPNWEVIDLDLPCSRCGYELRMLTVPRCPECGLHFRWREVFEARLRRSDFLLEHRWRERPLWSWFVTVTRALRPRRFWEHVSIHERIHVGPLVFLFCSGALIFAVALPGLAALSAGAVALLELLLVESGYAAPAVLSAIARHMLVLARMPLDVGWSYLLLMPTFITLQLLSATVLLCSLRQTLGRCRVRTRQVFRVAAYAAAPICLIWAALHVLMDLIEASVSWPLTGWAALMEPLVWVVLYVAPHGAYLAIGLKCYLQLPRAWLLGLTAAFFGLLFPLATFLFVGSYLLA